MRIDLHDLRKRLLDCLHELYKCDVIIYEEHENFRKRIDFLISNEQRKKDANRPEAGQTLQ